MTLELSKSVFSPLVSVIIPAYNAEIFLEKTLWSVCNQSYSNAEILVVDDGSSDCTPEIVQAFTQQDSRVFLLQQPNAGVAAARNLGIQKAQGEFIAPIDADDLWHPDAIAKLVAQFQKERLEVGVVYAWSLDIDEQDKSTGGFHAASIYGNVHKTLICHNFLGNASATLIRKTCIDAIGGYDTQLKAQKAQGCEDWDLYLRLAEHYEFGVIPEFLIGYRKMSSSMSGDFSQMARSHQLMLQSTQQNHSEISNYLYCLSRSSFYLYFAHQCSAQGQALTTLKWLWQAVKSDPISSLVRPRLYLLFIKTLLRLALDIETLPKSRHTTHQLSRSVPLFSETLQPLKLPIHPLKIHLKVLAGKILHQALLSI